MREDKEVKPDLPLIPECMMGDFLHWRILHSYIKKSCKKVGGFAKVSDVIGHFAPLRLSRTIRTPLLHKFGDAYKTLTQNGYISESLGIIDGRACVVATYLKDVTGSTNEAITTNEENI